MATLKVELSEADIKAAIAAYADENFGLCSEGENVSLVYTAADEDPRGYSPARFSAVVTIKKQGVARD